MRFRQEGPGGKGGNPFALVVWSGGDPNLTTLPDVVFRHTPARNLIGMNRTQTKTAREVSTDARSEHISSRTAASPTRSLDKNSG